MKRTLSLGALLCLVLWACEKDQSFLDFEDEVIFNTDERSRVVCGEVCEITKTFMEIQILKEVVLPLISEKFSEEQLAIITKQKVDEFFLEEYGFVDYYIPVPNRCNRIDKMLVRTANSELKSINILSTELQDFENLYLDMQNIEDNIASVSLSTVDDYIASFQNGSIVSGISDCKELLGLNNTGGTTINDGTTGGGGTGVGGKIGGAGGCWEIVIVCGCKPRHAGGNSSSKCRCSRANLAFLINLCPEGFTGDTKLESRNNGSDYWDCVDLLVSFNIIKETDIIVRRFENCWGWDDVNDVGPQSGNCGNNLSDDYEFCSAWHQYFENCFAGANQSATYETWAQNYLDNPGLFNDVVSDVFNCMSDEEFDCTSNIQNLQQSNNVNLSTEVINLIQNSIDCTSPLDLAEVLETLITNLQTALTSNPNYGISQSELEVYLLNFGDLKVLEAMIKIQEAFDEGINVIFDDLYFETNTPDDDYDYSGALVSMPNQFTLDDGSIVNIEFAPNANNPVSQDLIDAVAFALNSANGSLEGSDKITSIYVSATTNGEHSNTSNHFKGLAIDISRINGKRMILTGLTDQILQLQNALDGFIYLRENFGPAFKHKFSVEKEPGKKWDFNYPVSGHKDHIHYSVRR